MHFVHVVHNLPSGNFVEFIVGTNSQCRLLNLSRYVTEGRRETMAGAWTEDVSICTRKTLPSVPLHISRTILNRGLPDVIRPCCYWSDRDHKSGPPRFCFEATQSNNRAAGICSRAQIRFQKSFSEYHHNHWKWEMGPTSVPVGEKGRLTSTSCGWGAFKACVEAACAKTDEASWVKCNHFALSVGSDFKQRRILTY